MLNRLKKILKATKLSDTALDFVVAQQDRLVSGEIEVRVVKTNEPIAVGNLVEVVDNTKGEFLPDMSDEEVLDYERKERLGWKEFKLPWQV
jgi:hypothetical protein